MNNITGDFMHNSKNSHKNLYTDLILEQNSIKNNTIFKYKNISITRSTYYKSKYTTIYFDEIFDINSFKRLEEILIKELNEYLDSHILDKYLVIGLGNKESTPDSLGPKTIDKVIATSHLFSLGEVEKGYANISKFNPSVIGNTGIESYDLIKSIIKIIKPTKVIIIDSLKASDISRLTKTIQITNSGINPGSGINNDRGELSKKTLGVDVIVLGVPTVVDIKTIIKNTTNKQINLKDNLIVTPTNIDYLIERLSLLISNSINKSLHKNYSRQNTK